MVITTKKAVAFKDANGKELVLQRDFAGDVPQWVENTKFFQQLVGDGTIIVMASKKEKEKK